jgi:His-Xaa-Ser system protein HxsD
MTTPEGFPESAVRADVGASSVTLDVVAAVYPLDAVYSASFVFLDRAYILLDKPDDARFRITLTPKKLPADADVLRGWAGEFGNELLSAAWRHQIAKDNRAILEMVTSQALAASMGPPSLDDLAAFDFSDDAFEDPLGIAVSWEEKYKKKKLDDAIAGAASATEPSSGASPVGEGGESGAGRPG